MAIDKNSNIFTFGFAAAMVVVVGAILSWLAMTLKPAQDENVKREKMQDILKAVNVECERDDAPNLFNDYVKQRVVLDFNGDMKGEAKEGEIDKADKSDAFNIDIKKEYKAHIKAIVSTYKGDEDGYSAAMSAVEEVGYPLFVCEREGSTYYVVPMVGTGLWGPVWGYISFEDDMNTIYGATFDHKTETPGLGAEINQKFFQEPFFGEEILDENGAFVGVKIIKGGAKPDDKHGVDGITGGTITSNGVAEMIDRTLRIYNRYFEKQRSQ